MALAPVPPPLQPAETPDGPQPLEESAARSFLERLQAAMEQVLLQRQHPVSGLIPASTARTVHGDYCDAWVRDGVYTIQCVWGLAMAWRQLEGETRRTYELEKRVEQLMRGLLRAMMQQSDRVERFKHSLDRLDALHAKFDTATGRAVVADDAWGHLQLDATSLYLLQLAQITRAGLVLVQSTAERDFLQNLVYYVARTYRVADYGIWERGDKGNHGLPERNASSIGMAKAALEALDGLDLYGPHGDGRCRLLIPQGALVRLRRALQHMLPRESASKEADSACLSVIGYPAWSVDDDELISRTRDKIRRDLSGAYGYRRFRRDGHQTVIEDHTRLHYEREELAQFEGIECQWPLFFGYELVTACCEGRWREAWLWRSRLEAVSVAVDGVPLLPEVYRVPAEAIEAERRAPGTQPRQPNENVPLLWAQSLWWLGELMLHGLLRPDQLDPCGRRLPRPLGAERVLVSLVPQSPAVAERFRDQGVPLTPREGERVRVLPSAALARRLARVGRNPALGLSGHPPHRVATTSTARLYRDGETDLAFLPAVLDDDTFYLVNDPEQVVEIVKAELHLLQRHWQGEGQPLLLIPVCEGPFRSQPEVFLQLGRALADGGFDGVPVMLQSLDRLREHAGLVTLPEDGRETTDDAGAPAPAAPLRDGRPGRPLTAGEERELEEIPVSALAERLWGSTSLAEQAEVLEQLEQRLGPDAILQGPGPGGPVRLRRLLEEVYHRALVSEDWNLVRRCAGSLDLVHPLLDDAVTDLLGRQKQVVVGRNYTAESRIEQPAGTLVIAAMIRRYSGEDGRERMLQQELLLALDGLARKEPDLLDGTLTLQLGQLLLLLTGELAEERDLTPDEAFEALCGEPPHRIRQRLRAVLADIEHARAALQRKEQLHLSGRVRWQVPDPLPAPPGPGGWLRHRQRLGALQQVPRHFYAGIWELLHHCHGLVIGDKLERRNRLESRPLILEKTPGERNFASQVDHLLSKIEAPEYRQLCTETLLTLIAFVAANPHVQLEDYLALDVIIGHAVRVGWHREHPDASEAEYAPHKAEAWERFYAAPPAQCRRWLVEALRVLADLERESETAVPV
jgi:phosphorylase kinase alpha/beta subunit